MGKTDGLISESGDGGADGREPGNEVGTWEGRVILD